MTAKHRKEEIQFLVRKAMDNNVRFIRIWFTDILGFLKSFAITIDQLERTLTQGAGLDGSAIEGFARSDEHDMIALPDIKTFQVLPWRPRENAVARMFADIRNMDGSAFEGDSRHCLKRQLKRAAQLGYTFYVGPELEYYYFKEPHNPEPIDQGGYFDLTPLDAGSDLRRETVLVLEEMGIAVHSSHHEVAPSQHEIDLRYMDALTMADATMTYRLVVKEIAMKQNLHATFMPKPLQDQNGNGMHVHQSLFYAKKGDSNAFYDKKDKNNLSRLAKQYMAGLLTHAREMAIVTNQWPNSYKRLVSGYEAPTSIFWAQKDSLSLVRIPLHKKGKPEETRIEFRAPDPACNPYLVYSAMLAAGLEGVQKKYKLSNEVYGKLPTNLGEAIQVAEKSSFLKRALGAHIYNSLIENKRIEWDRYQRHITSYELKRDLPNL